MIRPVRRAARLTCIVVAATLVAPAAAVAHANLVDTNPRNGAALVRAPARVVVRFGDVVRTAPGNAAVRNGGASVLAGRPRTHGRHSSCPFARAFATATTACAGARFRTTATSSRASSRSPSERDGRRLRRRSASRTRSASARSSRAGSSSRGCSSAPDWRSSTSSSGDRSRGAISAPAGSRSPSRRCSSPRTGSSARPTKASPRASGWRCRSRLPSPRRARRRPPSRWRTGLPRPSGSCSPSCSCRCRPWPATRSTPVDPGSRCRSTSSTWPPQPSGWAASLRSWSIVPREGVPPEIVERAARRFSTFALTASSPSHSRAPCARSPSCLPVPALDDGLRPRHPHEDGDLRRAARSRRRLTRDGPPGRGTAAERRACRARARACARRGRGYPDLAPTGPQLSGLAFVRTSSSHEPSSPVPAGSAGLPLRAGGAGDPPPLPIRVPSFPRCSSCRSRRITPTPATGRCSRR